MKEEERQALLLLDSGQQELRGRLMATTAMSHALIVAIIQTHPDLAHALRDQMQRVYDALPSALHGAVHQAFESEWRELHRLLPPH